MGKETGTVPFPVLVPCHLLAQALDQSPVHVLD